MSNLLQKLLAGLSSRPEAPIIALVTDFGTRDPYAGSVKAVIATINPYASVIDITHEVAPHDVREGAYALWSAHRFFPPGTIFVAVVDPGVGTDREILIVEAGSFTFVAPENGLLDLVLSEHRPTGMHSVRTSDASGRWRRYALGEVTRTFHGRDVFAPLAAHLSLGVRAEQIGEPRALKVPSDLFCDPGAGTPALLHIDRFGNLVTNIRVPSGAAGITALRVGSHTVRTRVSSYMEAPPGRPCLIAGSSGLLEVVVRGSSAAQRLHATMKTKLALVVK